MKNFTFKKALYTLGGGSLALMAIFLMLSSAKSDSTRRCTGLIININETSKQLLVKPEDVKNWATLNGSEPFDGKVIQDIDLKAVERRVENSGIIKDCQAFIDLKGNLILNVDVLKPIARVIGNGHSPDRFMDKTGKFFPVSKNFTPTVLLLSGDYVTVRKGLESQKNQDLVQFINTITQDEFWSAQITRVDISKTKEIHLVPLLGENIIEFGKPEKVDTKLKKLLVFYKKIMPEELWSGFSRISVKYDGQIVCS